MSVYDVHHPRPAPRPAPRKAAPKSRNRVERLRPVSPLVRRYAAWFLAAGWTADETAILFDVAPEGLGPDRLVS